MIKNSKNIKIKKSILLILMLTFFSCKKEQTVYYAYYSNRDTPDFYIKKHMETKGKSRVEIDAYFDTHEELTEENVDFYEVLPNGLKKGYLKKEYLTIDSHDCIEYPPNNRLATFAYVYTCYLGEVEITIGNKTYNNVHKFKQIKGMHSDSETEKYVYYDKDFVLLKEEYFGDFLEGHFLVRIDQVPLKEK